MYLSECYYILTCSFFQSCLLSSEAVRHVIDLSKFVMKTIEQLQVLVCQPGPNAAYAVEIVTDKCVPTSYLCMYVCMYINVRTNNRTWI